MSFFLTVHLGDRAVRVALVDDLGNIHQTATNPIATQRVADDGFEQDPEDWWQATLAGIEEVRCQNPTVEISGIACTGRWSTTVPLDSRGKVLHKALGWRDQRGRQEIANLGGGNPWRSWRWRHKSAGLPPKSGDNALGHILYLKEQAPDVYRGTDVFLEAKDYLNFRLTGKIATSYDAAASLWVTDLRKLSHVRYDEDLLRMTGLDSTKLASLYPAIQKVGNLKPDLAQRFKMDEATPVFVSSPDFHCKALGSGAVLEFEPHLHLGSAIWLSCHMKTKKSSTNQNLATLPSTIPNCYLVTGSHNDCGAGITKVRELLGSGTAISFADLEKLASQAPPGSDDLMYLPWLSGLRAPVTNPQKRAGWIGLGLEHGSPHFARSVYEGIALHTRWLSESLQEFTGQKISRVRIVGTGAESAIWSQILADILVTRIDVVENPQMSALRGAGFLCALALQTTSVERIQTLPLIDHSYAPQPGRVGIYDRLYMKFREASGDRLLQREASPSAVGAATALR